MLSGMSTTTTTAVTRTLTASQRAAVARTLRASYRFHPLARRTPVSWVVLASGRVESVPTSASVGAYESRPVVAVVTESLPKFHASQPNERFTIEGTVHPEGCARPVHARIYGATLDGVVAAFRAAIQKAVVAERYISASPERLLERALKSVDWTGWASDDHGAWRAMVDAIDAAKAIAATMDPEVARRVWLATVPTDGRAMHYAALPASLAPSA